MLCLAEQDLVFIIFWFNYLFYFIYVFIFIAKMCISQMLHSKVETPFGCVITISSHYMFTLILNKEPSALCAPSTFRS